MHLLYRMRLLLLWILLVPLTRLSGNALSVQASHPTRTLSLPGFLNFTDYSTPDTFLLPAPEDLSIEFIRRPETVLLKDASPEFAWRVPKAAIFQSAYQILVATSKEKLDSHLGDVWDSGRVESRNSISVEYAGPMLQYHTTYYWKVRVWGSKKAVSDYSISQAFQLDTIQSTQTSANTFQVEHLAPVLFQQKGKDSYFLDFRKAAFATLEFDYEAKTKHTLTIRIGEQCLQGQINRQPEGTIRYQEILVPVVPGKNKYVLPIKPDARNTKPGAILLPDSFPVLLPFRYAEFENVLGKLRPEGIRQVAYHSYWEEDQSSFTSSDTILNRIWELCKYSIKATTFAGIYVDGDRERIPYEADAYLNQLSHYCVDREYAPARQTIEYFFDSRPTWPTEWQLHVAMMLYQDYMYTGNTELIERYYERLKVKTLMALAVEDGFISIESPKHNGQFLLELGFPDSTTHLNDIVDWPPESNHFGNIKRYQKGERDGYVFTRINTVVNAFYYHNMRIMARFATLLDKPDEALDFAYRAARVKKAINEQLFDKEKGYYRDGIGTDHGSLHANMVLLAFDVVPYSRQQEVVQYLKTKGMACSVYGAQYLIEALFKAGESDYARTLLSATDDRSWYNMIRVGATITMESWDMKYKVNADWNHAWGAAPANLIPRYLWGIQPGSPGYGTARIKPQLGSLTSSSIEVPTLRGKLQANYQRDHRSRVYTITLPANMVAEFEIPFTEYEVILLDGEPVLLDFGTIRLSPGTHRIEIK